MYTVYRVYITPRDGLNSYGSEIEVSDFVKFDGLPNIKRSIDSTDFEFGVYNYDDLTIKAANLNGYFNDENDSRSIFKSGRDRTKVRVVFSNADGDTIVYRGLINEEATRLDPDGDEISFRVLSLDSVIRNTKVIGGTINDGEMVSDAIFSILNTPTITAVLGIDEANINPDNDFAIDNAADFNNKSTRDVLNQLLLASNSVMLIDTSQNVIIRDRAADITKNVLNLYGPFDLQQRTNIIGLTTYNAGRQRMFTAVKVNDTEVSDADFAHDYGYRQKKITLGFITTDALEEDVASRLMEEFKVSKVECTVQVPTYVVRGVELLDRISLNYPLRVKPVTGKFLPVIGSTVIGDTDAPLPYTFGSLSVEPRINFKVIEIVENPKEFTTLLKLRQNGNTPEDGVFDFPGNCIVGFAKVGDGVICSGGSACDKFNPSVIGAAQIGCTEVA